tara:strand:+ start:229 stop:1149 length:921 start_codon:yes stop_codon:yes gene_type:complete
MNTSHIKKFDDEIDLKDVFITLYSHKLTVISFTLIFALISLSIALYLPNSYSSKALLASTSTEDTLSSKLSNLSALSSIAGINIAGDDSSKSTQAIARIQSYDFFKNEFVPKIRLENLMAVQKWNQENNTIAYKKSIYDETTKKWSLKFLSPKSELPSIQKAFEEYLKILSISEDRKTSFVSISIEHKSPIVAKKWLEHIIDGINEIMRIEDISKAQNSINFLNESVKSTNVQSIKEAISSLLESQMKTLMLANSNDSYVFKVLDAPIVSEKKTGPNRALICILGTLIGFMLSLFLILINKVFKSY